MLNLAASPPGERDGLKTQEEEALCYPVSPERAKARSWEWALAEGQALPWLELEAGIFLLQVLVSLATLSLMRSDFCSLLVVAMV